MTQVAGDTLSVPIVMRAQQGGGRKKAAKHAQYLTLQKAQVPELIVVDPPTPADTKELLTSAIGTGIPVMFIKHTFFTTQDGKSLIAKPLFSLSKPINSSQTATRQFLCITGC